MKKKVILGLSGGVDSSVSVIRLLEMGYDVEAVFMRNWDSTTNNDVSGNPDLKLDVCPQELDYQDALAIANQLNIKLHRIDFIEEYWQKVFSYFLKEYELGRTPNPDILCNKEIKFKAFLDYAFQLGADYIAMGHYARVVHGETPHLLKGLDENKDQTYFLCQLTKEQLNKSLFPIGDMKKAEVRMLAEKYQLATAKKKDSTGICFIGERDFKEFLKNYLPSKKGNIMTLDNQFIGNHDGLMYYTIGQRKGLKIGGLDGFNNEAWYVIGKNLSENILYVGQGFHHQYLYSDNCIVTNVNWINEKFTGKLKIKAKFRYRQNDHDVLIEWINETTLFVSYPQKIRAVTPGQACVFYDNDICLGGGDIDEVFLGKEKRMY